MPSMTYQPTTSTNTRPILPLEQRHWPLSFANPDGSVGATAYPINYDELYNLKGRLLTLVDATFTDPEQRKAHKDMVWQTLRAWLEDIARTGQDADTTSLDLKVNAEASHARS